MCLEIPMQQGPGLLRPTERWYQRWRGWVPLHQPQKQPTSPSDNPNCHPSRVVTACILNAITLAVAMGNGQPREGMYPQGLIFFFFSRTMKLLTFP